jgi:hypothetical protein
MGSGNLRSILEWKFKTPFNNIKDIYYKHENKSKIKNGQVISNEGKEAIRKTIRKEYSKMVIFNLLYLTVAAVLTIAFFAAIYLALSNYISNHQ